MDISKEEKVDDPMSGVSTQTPKKEPLTLMKALFGDCLCNTAFHAADQGGPQSSQFINIHGIEFIGMGAVADELTAKERVYDTLEQLTTRTERLISIGYLSKESKPGPQSGDTEIMLETVPLDVWNKTYPNDQSMSKRLKRMVNNIKTNQFDSAISDFKVDLKAQRAQPLKGTNGLMAGITSHNLGVLYVLGGKDDQAIPLFEEAIERKRQEFGADHPEVAISLDEIGIQYFAREQFAHSLAAFNEARRIRAKEVGGDFHHPKMAMVLNNIACCNFHMGQHDHALKALQEAREIVSDSTGTSTKADLDLLHVAIVQCNYAYLLLRGKMYDDARSIFEEALLIQQSVLGDNHRAIRDTLSNIEFTNAFHS